MFPLYSGCFGRGSERRGAVCGRGRVPTGFTRDDMFFGCLGGCYGDVYCLYGDTRVFVRGSGMVNVALEGGRQHCRIVCAPRFFAMCAVAVVGLLLERCSAVFATEHCYGIEAYRTVMVVVRLRQERCADVCYGHEYTKQYGEEFLHL